MGRDIERGSPRDAALFCTEGIPKDPNLTGLSSLRLLTSHLKLLVSCLRNSLLRACSSTRVGAIAWALFSRSEDELLSAMASCFAAVAVQAGYWRTGAMRTPT